MSGEQNNSKIWIWIDFVKPGRNTFIVKTTPEFEIGKTKESLYVYKFLGSQRSEDLNCCKF